MATIRQRKTIKGKTKYQAIVRRKGAPEIVQTFGRKTDAKAWAEQIEAHIKVGRFLPQIEAEKHTVAEAIDRYLEEHLSELSEREQWIRKPRLKWWRKKIGMLSLASLTPAVIADTRDALMKGDGPSEEPVVGSTANRYLACLSAVLKLAVNDWGWLQENPARRITRKKESTGRVRFLGQQDDADREGSGEQERLLKACEESDDPRLRPLVLCALVSGARQGELLGLRWSDVDLSADPPGAVLDETKNSDRRKIFFPGEAGLVLREMKKTPHINGFVFASKGKGKLNGKRYFPRKAWEIAVAAAQIEDFRFHDLRHSAASYLAMSGSSLAVIQTVLGHRAVQTTRRYAHIAEEHSAKAVEHMAEKFLA